MKIGIALSGGGAKGIAHLGVLQALEEADIEIEEIAGTSAGALLGSLYASGVKPKEILKIVQDTSVFKNLKFAFTLTGLLSIDKLKEVLTKHISENDFSSLKKKLYVTATELKAGKTVYFSEGELISPVLASCSVPVIFNPMQYNEGIYVDGGILKNLPVEVLKNSCDFVIGSDCNPIDDKFKLTGVKKLVERSLLLAINSNNKESKKKCDFVFEAPGMKDYSAFDIGKAEEIYQVGYDSAKDRMEDLQHELQNRAA